MNSATAGTIFKPGTVVCANYKTFDDVETVGLFLVVYDESVDAHHSYKNNLLVLKITTTPTMVSNYSISLMDGRNPFLKRDCMVVCSKLHTIDKKSVYKTLGAISPYTFRTVYKSFRKFLTELERQMEDYI